MPLRKSIKLMITTATLFAITTGSIALAASQNESETQLIASKPLNIKQSKTAQKPLKIKQSKPAVILDYQQKIDTGWIKDNFKIENSTNKNIYNFAKVHNVHTNKLTKQQTASITVHDQHNHSKTTKFNYAVVDTESPTIIKNPSVTGFVGDKINYLTGLEMRDNYSHKLKQVVTHVGKTDVTVTVTDESGNKTEVSRKLVLTKRPIVKTAQKPASKPQPAQARQTPKPTPKPKSVYPIYLNGIGLAEGGYIAGGAKTPAGAIIYKWGGAPNYYLADKAGYSGRVALGLGVGSTITIHGTTYTIYKIRNHVSYNNAPSDIYGNDVKLQTCVTSEYDMRIYYAR